MPASLTSLPFELLEHLVEYMAPLDILGLRGSRREVIPDKLWPAVSQRFTGRGIRQKLAIPYAMSARHALSLRFPRHHSTMYHIRCQYHACSRDIRVPHNYREFVLIYLRTRDEYFRDDEKNLKMTKTKKREEDRNTRQQSMANDRDRRRNERMTANLLRDCKSTVRRHALPPSQRG
jgi:hypothetical protein